MIKGFTLIEFLLAITLILILVTIISDRYILQDILHENTLSRQKYFLQREAQYALDFIINGTSILASTPQEFKSYRFGGLIDSDNVVILKEADENSSDEIKLYDSNNILMGRILTNKPNQGTSLIFDNDENLKNGYYRRIIPHGNSPEALFNDPNNQYIIIVKFNRNQIDPNDLIEIAIKLKQKISSREIEAEMRSAVNLRKY